VNGGRWQIAKKTVDLFVGAVQLIELGEFVAIV
jgi:hypothetical protein